MNEVVQSVFDLYIKHLQIKGQSFKAGHVATEEIIEEIFEEVFSTLIQH